MNIPQSGKEFASPYAVKFISKKVLETLFRPGRNLRGIVTKDLGDGKFLFRVAKYNLVATSLKPLSVGQQVRVLVRENKPKLLLKINPEIESDAPLKQNSEQVNQEKPEEILHLYLRFTDSEFVARSHLQVDENETEVTAGEHVSFVLHLQDTQTGESKYQFRISENNLFLDIATDKLPWFQILRNGMTELQEILQTQTGVPGFTNIKLDAQKKSEGAGKSAKYINMKI
ncbi:MAG: hypothetical protein H6696_08435 [Deferribacteres bacterium]|nr:hypothetical protein [candidate division KSB1 bacterium]MCB9501950.1 hypothetical protein [Deferribacteres bacterium]